jgi:hypothetical protein
LNFYHLKIQSLSYFNYFYFYCLDTIAKRYSSIELSNHIISTGLYSKFYLKLDFFFLQSQILIKSTFRYYFALHAGTYIFRNRKKQRQTRPEPGHCIFLAITTLASPGALLVVLSACLYSFSTRARGMKSCKPNERTIAEVQGEESPELPQMSSGSVD